MTQSVYHVFPGHVSGSKHFAYLARKLFTSKGFLQKIRIWLEFALAYDFTVRISLL